MSCPASLRVLQKHGMEFMAEPIKIIVQADSEPDRSLESPYLVTADGKSHVEGS